MSKHTPGPWKFYTKPQPNGCPIVGNSSGLMVAMLAHSTNHEEQREESEANARLIAAAPELLAELDECRKFLEDMHCQSAEITVAESQARHSAVLAVIAKATGADNA